MINVEMKGLKEIENSLLRLGSVAGEKTIRSVLFRAAKPIWEQARQNIAAIPTGSGALHKATRRVQLRTVRFSAGGSRFAIGVAPKAKDRTAVALANLHYRRRKPIRGVFWGHLVEWGFTTRSGVRVPGRHVFLNAIQARTAQAFEVFRVQIGIAVERALKKKFGSGE